MRVFNFGSGILDITTNGDSTGGTLDGVYGLAAGAGGLRMTVADTSTVSGGQRGLRLINTDGLATVTINGDVTGTNFDGAYIRNNGTNSNITIGAGSTVEGGTFGLYARQDQGYLNVTINGEVTGGTDDGVYAWMQDAGGDLTLTVAEGATVNGNANGVNTLNDGTGDLRVIVNGTIVGDTAVRAEHTGTGDLNVTNAAGNAIYGSNAGINARHTGDGNINLTTDGEVSGGNYAIFAQHTGAGDIDITPTGDVLGGTFAIIAQHTGTGDIGITTTAGTATTGETGIFAGHGGTGELNITLNNDILGTDNDGIFASHLGGGPINLTVNAGRSVTSNGGDADDFAVQTTLGATNLTVAGTLNGGAGGAVSFDQTVDTDDRLELHTTGVINGTVFAGGGTDTLAFAGTGNGSFNLADIDTGTNTRQYRAFETFIVESAVWTMNNTTSADFIVNGGTLKGNGTFGSLTVNQGTLSPGNSIGTMTVNGVFSLNAGAIFEVEVNPNNMGDVVIVNGTVNITGATLRILAANGDYALETDYVIIDNDGTDAVNGTFGTVTSNLAFLIPTVLYNGGTGNDVVLRLERNNVDTCDITDTDNQNETCEAIDEDNPLYPYILALTEDGARQAYDALSGEIHATIAGVLVDDNRYVREAIMGRLMQAGHTGGNGQVSALGAAGPQVASLDSSAMALGYGGKSLGTKSLAPPPRSPLAFWTAGYGAWGAYNGDGNAATANRDLGGFMSGMDAQLGGSWRLGLTTGASFSNVSVDKRHSSADAESYYLGGYTGGMVGAFALRGGGTWAWSDIDTSRAVIFPGFYERQKASYDADTSQIFGELAYPTTVRGMSVEPFAGLAYVSIDTDTFVERGGPLASLRGRDSDQNVGYTTVGLRIANTTQWGSVLVTPHLSARWQHAFDDVTPEAALAFATTGSGFTVAGVPLAEDSALIDAGFDFALGENTTAGVSYSGQFGEGVHDNAVKGRFTWLF